MSHFQIRYNTKNNGGPLKWRVIIDEKETLASHIEIDGHVYGESSFVDGKEKINIACDGKIYWDGTRARVSSVESSKSVALVSSKTRSLAKSLTWRVLAIIVTFGSIYVLTGELETATAGTLLTNSINFILYYLHERVWLQTKWGITKNNT